MSVSPEKKSIIIRSNRLHKFDTGSLHVQVAILTERINNITDHLKVFKKDLHGKHGLLKLVSRRKKLLAYIKEKNFKDYSTLIKGLGIRK